MIQKKTDFEITEAMRTQYNEENACDAEKWRRLCSAFALSWIPITIICMLCVYFFIIR